MSTEYPNNGTVKISAKGADRIAIRIPSWCESFQLNKSYIIENGYAIVENDGTDIELSLDMPVRTVYADSRIRTNIGKVCITRGPIVYCAEAIDNSEHLSCFVIPENLDVIETLDKTIGLVTLQIACKKLGGFENGAYSYSKPLGEKAVLKLIPFNYFANRGESDMMVWFGYKYQ